MKVDLMRFPLFVFAFLLASSPGFAQERQWNLDASDKQAFLVFGVPDTADVGLSFWCDIGSKKMSLFVPVSPSLLKPSETPDVVALVDGRSFKFKGEVEKDQASGLVNIESHFLRDDAFFKAVQQGQIIAVQVKSERKSYPLAEADFDGLIRACNGDEVN